MEENNIKKLVKYYHENKLSHAYLIETNNLDKCYEDLIEVIKMINCKDEFTSNCDKCNICNLINQGFLPSLVVIEASGASIKKEQVLELKRMFSTVPIYTKNNIYVIKMAEKLNGASANTMLKFLEEPEDNIIGFFITLNSNNVLTTIKSRCEVIKNFYDKDLSINTENNLKYDVAIEYLYKLEVEKKKLIMYNRDVILNKFNEREDIKEIFKIILYIYESLLKGEVIPKLESLVNIDKNILYKRINKVTQVLEVIDSNVNIELLLDKYVIELGD